MTARAFLRAFARRHGVVVVLAALAFTASIVVRETVFPYYSGNKDEGVYVMQGQTYAAGQLTLDYPAEHRDFFRPWLTGVRDGEVFFVFPPGWPALIAAADRLGDVRLAIAATAAAAVLGLYALALELTRRRRVALLAAAMLTASPILVVQSGLFLSYVLTLACGCWLGFALLRGMRTTSRAALVAAGLLLGWIFLTRPYDAGLWSIPFAAYLGWVYRGRWPHLVRGVAWVVAGALPLVALALVHNALVTDEPFLFPITAAEPLNTFGFGSRRISPVADPIDYTLGTAFEASGRNLAAVPGWVLGTWVGLALAALGVWVRRRDSATWLLIGIAAVFPIGYLYYWGIVLMGDGAKGIGPQYYLPFWVGLPILGAEALAWLWGRVRWVPAVVGVAVVALTIPALVDKIRDNHSFSQGFESWADALDAGSLRNALVFVPTGSDPYLLTELSFTINDPDLDGPVVYAADLHDRDVELVAAQPDRDAFVLTEVLDRGGNLFDPDDRSRERIPLELLEAPAVTIRTRIENDTERSVVVAYLDTPCGEQWQVLDAASARGEHYDVTWEYRASDCPRATSGRLSVGVQFGDTPELDQGGEEGAEHFERRYSSRAEDENLQVLTPGEPYHTVLFPDGAVWARELVEPVLDVEVLPAPEEWDRSQS